VLSVAAAESPLARISDALIAVPPYDRTELMTPLASRLNHHLVVNMLVTAIAITSGSEFPDQLPALDFWQTEKI
jgi:RpiR family carbohydrate utilization transcriptional regulator